MWVKPFAAMEASSRETEPDNVTALWGRNRPDAYISQLSSPVRRV